MTRKSCMQSTRASRELPWFHPPQELRASWMHYSSCTGEIRWNHIETNLTLGSHKLVHIEQWLALLYDQTTADEVASVTTQQQQQHSSSSSSGAERKRLKRKRAEVQNDWKENAERNSDSERKSWKLTACLQQFRNVSSNEIVGENNHVYMAKNCKFKNISIDGEGSHWWTRILQKQSMQMACW